MEIYFKLNFFPDALLVYNRDLVRQLVGYADRREYLEKELENAEARNAEGICPK